MYGKLWRKIEDNIESKISNSYKAKYIKIKYHSDDDLLQRKTLDFYDVIIAIKFVLYIGDRTFYKFS